MADQDSPLDLTIRKDKGEPSGQDEVLDLSTKGRCSTSLPKSASSSAVPPVKGSLHLAKARDLQSTSTLEQFMAKLCLHHQQQIADALGFLQTEVKAVVAPPRAPDHTDSNLASQQHAAMDVGVDSERGTASMTGCRSLVPEEPAQGACTSSTADGLSAQQKHANTLYLHGHCSEDGGDSSLSPDIIKSGERENRVHSNVLNAAGEKSDSLVEVNLSSSSHPVEGTLEERQCNPNTPSRSSRGGSHPVTLDSSSVRHGQGFCPLHLTGQTGSSGNTKDFLAGPYPVLETSKTSCAISPRKARKSRRRLYPLARDFSVCRVDYDGHYDIVYVSKPVTESEVCPRHRLPLRQNARKSTRGHTYLDEIWQLKTVRTLSLKAKDNEKGDWPAPIAASNTLVTPVQVPGKPDGVPPVDIPLAGGCEEAISQNEPGEEPAEIVTAECNRIAFTDSECPRGGSPTSHTQNEEQPLAPVRHQDAVLDEQEVLDPTSVMAVLEDARERSGDPGGHEDVQPPDILPPQIEGAPAPFVSDTMSTEDGLLDCAEAETCLQEDQPIEPPPEEILSKDNPAVEREEGVQATMDELEKQGNESACQETHNILHETSEVETPPTTEPESATHLVQLEKDGALNEATVVVPASISTKKVNGSDDATLDRCLRSTKKTSLSESVKLCDTAEEMPEASEENVSESPRQNLRTHGTADVKPRDEPGRVLRSSSVGKANADQVEGAIQTRSRPKLTLIKGGVNDSGIQVSTGPSTEMESPKVAKDSREKRATMSPRDCLRTDAKVAGAMESCGKMQLRKDSESVCAGESLSSMTSGKNHFGSKRPHSLDCLLKTRPEKQALKQKDADKFGLCKMELLGSNPHKFVGILKKEENQQLISSLNNKYDKMQRGWIQIDRVGQHMTGRSKNRADRLKEIWKSKRRVRKVKCVGQLKSSPVHMLFTKTFDLSTICHWFLQTTETKSLVITKKANTRLSSETQLCFHSSSGMPGSSHGVFPSLQAERLKKHLKKFAVASPVKSNPKNQRLISKAWERGDSCSRGRDMTKELTRASGICTKRYSEQPQERPVQTADSVKAAGRSPASARILRKYSNIREKLQVQQRTLTHKAMHREVLQKLMPRSKPAAEQREKVVAVAKNHGERQPPASVSHKPVEKVITKETGAKKRSSAALSVKNHDEPKRCLKVSSNADTAPPCPSNSRSKKKAAVSPGEAKVHGKVLRSSVPGSGLPEHMLEVKPSVQDQVVTRSQRKTEITAMSSVSRSGMKRTLDLKVAPAKRTRASHLK
nr:uncharacterized protein LOC111849576 [Paramormyrops kingsleyae]XP_023678354.1 uncharacterized protein LOC111849576 [Paramormyrops kingsleyae]XP_023678355.1 uncharacterized protein LOC111849576 [Paramormyrops kingsleyae]XP_023678357.1 uncharacterized protein LOC111849576 [Paramormyrops kingsleyae]XP_023678358.1 uncharacterized protein LOC111849576 [Paramormyrops kingsleyae]XP_023678359.1 uncharacterized protein LOC111849576 [Paramormyrops kingsleyae]